MKRVYLDYAATTPTDPQVIKAMEPFFYENFGNASSPHATGRDAKKAIEDARQKVADFLGAQLEEIIFTSGGTESNNHALFGIAESLKSKGNHIIVSTIEHHSISEAAMELEKKGFKVTFVRVDKAGLVNPQDIAQAITDKTILVSVMHANNEIGTIQPIADVGKITKQKGVYFHSDGVQTVGHIPVNVSELNVDLLSMSGHKFCGPKGVGALFVRKGVKLSKYLIGGGQERGRRASTHNVPGIVGFAKAIELCRQNMDKEAPYQTHLRDKIISEIPKKINDCQLNGDKKARLPGNVNFSFSGVDGESLLMSLDMVGIAASMGSACTSGALEASHVLKAIGLSDEMALGSLRVSLGRWNTEEDVDYLLEQLPEIVKRLRKLAGKK